MLRFYALYKQSTEGPCQKPKPAFWDAVGRAKHNAWSQLGQMSGEKAMQEYVEEIKKVKKAKSNRVVSNFFQIVETMSFSPDVADLTEALGSFYEYVKEDQVEEEAFADESVSDSGVDVKGDAELNRALGRYQGSETDEEEDDQGQCIAFEMEGMVTLGAKFVAETSNLAEELSKAKGQIEELKVDKLITEEAEVSKGGEDADDEEEEPFEDALDQMHAMKEAKVRKSHLLDHYRMEIQLYLIGRLALSLGCRHFSGGGQDELRLEGARRKSGKTRRREKKTQRSTVLMRGN